MRVFCRSVLVSAAVFGATLAGVAVAGAQGTDAKVVADWERTLSGLETQLHTLGTDDQRGAAAVAAAVRDLDAMVSAWLLQRGQAVEQAREGRDLASVVAGLSRVRALVAQARTIATSASGEAGVFYLGRVDVAVTALAERESPSVTSIDAEQLRALGAKTVTEALESAPGVTQYRMGPRNEGMVYIRGFDLRQVPLFIDGVPVYVPYDGYVDLDRFVTDDLSEVRVTKGMTSVLIGPNALGGAINLVTKRPTTPFSGLFNVGGGSGGESLVDGNIGVRRPRWYVQATGSWSGANNFPLSGAFVPNAGDDGGARNNSSHSDGKGNIKFALTPARGGEYAISYVGQRGQKDVPPYAGTSSAVTRRFWRWPDWDKDALYFVSNTPLSGSQYLRARAYYDRFYNLLQSFDDAAYTAQTRPSSFNSIYDDYSVGGNVEYGTSFSRQTLRAAFHIKEDIHREHNVGSPVQNFDNRTVSGGVEDVFVISPRVSVIAGVGFDRQMTRQAENNVNGSIVSFPLGDTGGVNPQAGIYLETPGSGRLRATAFMKTRLPSIKDRYSYRMGRAIPNPDLKAEQATTVEGGWDGKAGKYGSAGVTVFYTAVNDLVQAFFLQPNLFQLQNVGDVRNSGFEAEWRVRPVGDFQGSIGYSYLHRSTVSTPAVPLLNTPNNKLFGYVAYRGIRRVRLVASLNTESSRQAQDDAGLLLTLSSYATMGAKAVLSLYTGLDVEVSGLNLFDHDYAIYPGFPEPGRVGLVQLRYRF
jgi:iron complex outermembrane receptor protein